MLAWDDACDRWLDVLKVERNLSPLTLDAYSRDLRQLGEWLAARGVGAAGAVTSTQLIDFMQARAAAKVSSRSRARQLSAIRGLFRFLRGERYIEADPTAPIDSPRLPRKLPQVYSLAQIDELLAMPDRNTPRGLRDAAMIEAIYSTGMRVSELVNLGTDDLDLARGCVRVFGKGRKQRLIPVGEVAAELID